ncbi:TPA: hypothetical protein L4Q76_001633 [Pseudomonas aeruginosa]|uniref:hypothetical protein n=1 Tax=Pseudomonas aeruginosa TaxID=287 RepID=UPI0003B95EAB|nr:hypothetical protein [Pseudomonas aeruginosa]EKT9493056.1 hypothetical protein [Pseudomonas aeruginosa]ERY35577.1 hypothetical protein Q067_02212 [Pseudomonas aeruginosa BL13]MBH4028423.1 hypothetical protein [Pseudomonas aeruginosa]MBV5530607.1 hypothetical protein [Pseudomonas aeruginosa]MCS8095352.1 hypothetical protein [Pseudomonas aeruginosa]
MDHSDTNKKTSVHAQRAYSLILSGVAECDTALDQRLLLDSLICQCAVFTRILGGEREFYDLLEKLKRIDLDVAGDLLPATQH